MYSTIRRCNLYSRYILRKHGLGIRSVDHYLAHEHDIRELSSDSSFGGAGKRIGTDFRDQETVIIVYSLN